MADRIGGAVGVGDRPIEQADRVVAFEVGRVRQHQVGVRHHLAGVGVAVDDARDAICAGLVLVGEPVHGLARVHRRVPAHVRHEHQQGVDAVGIAGVRIADHGMQQAVRGQRIRPRIGMVDALRLAGRVHHQILGAVHEAQRRGVERAVVLARLAGPVGRRHRFRERRLVAEAARRVDRAQQHLQHVQRAAGVEAVAVRADAAHRVHRHRPADHRVVSCGPRHRSSAPAIRDCSRTRPAPVRARCGGWCRRGCRSARSPHRANTADRDSVRRAAGTRARRCGRRAG